jgi:hypothetical protein
MNADDQDFIQKNSLSLNICIPNKIWFISKFVGQIFDESLPRARKERQIAPQASAGYSLSLNSLPAIRKAQRGRDKKASEKSQTPPPESMKDMCLMVASKMTFLPGPRNHRAF